jgi:hypothetical protein
VRTIFEHGTNVLNPHMFCLRVEISDVIGKSGSLPC